MGTINRQLRAEGLNRGTPLKPMALLVHYRCHVPDRRGLRWRGAISQYNARNNTAAQHSSTGSRHSGIDDWQQPHIGKQLAESPTSHAAGRAPG